jgi:hypothetical protein
VISIVKSGRDIATTVKVVPIPSNYNRVAGPNPKVLRSITVDRSTGAGVIAIANWTGYTSAITTTWIIIAATIDPPIDWKT